MDERLVVHLRAIAAANDSNYGSARMTRALREAGFVVNEKRVARLMREQGIRAKHKKKFRITTQSKHRLPVAPNRLGQRFEASHPNQVWLADITYVWTAEGWMYLAAVMDLCSRCIVGWALSERIDTALVKQALLTAVWRRKPPRALILHSDRGAQYCAKEYQDELAAFGVVASMSRPGNCYDNAPMESFFKTLKVERIYGRRYQTRAELRSDLFHYIELYFNSERLHSSLGYRSPQRFEQALGERKAA